MKETIVDQEFIEQMNEYRVPQYPSMGLIEASSHSFVVFCEKMTGWKLRSWQVKVAVALQDAVHNKHWTKVFTILTSRQIGKTVLGALFCAWCLVFNKYPGGQYNNTLIGVVSASDDQARRLVTEIRKMFAFGDRFLEKTYQKDGKPLFKKGLFMSLIDKTQPNNTEQLSMRAWDKDRDGPYLLVGSNQGSALRSFPPTTKILGYTFGILWIDEAGKSEKITDEFYNDYAEPTTDEMDAIKIMTSTPWQPSGKFYRDADPEDAYEHANERMLFTIDAIKLEAPERYERTMKKIERMNAAGSTDEVQRQYYGRFVKGENSFFGPDKVEEVFAIGYEKFTTWDGVCDIGVDFGGQVSSRTVITVSTMDEEGEIYRLYHRTYPVGEDDSLMDDLEFDIMERFPNWQRIVPDDAPVGAYLIREMQDKGWDVHPMMFRRDKVKKFGAFRAMLNKNKIHSYKDDDLKTEMIALETNTGSRQSVITAPPGYNDDLTDSFVMSCYFYVQDESKKVGFFDWDDV